MQHVYVCVFRDLSYAQALAVREEAEQAAFFFIFSDLLTCKEFASSINGKYLLNSGSEWKMY